MTLEGEGGRSEGETRPQPDPGSQSCPGELAELLRAEGRRNRKGTRDPAGQRDLPSVTHPLLSRQLPGIGHLRPRNPVLREEPAQATVQRGSPGTPCPSIPKKGGPASLGQGQEHPAQSSGDTWQERLSPWTVLPCVAGSALGSP